MNFEDATVVRLDDPGTRGMPFDDASLGQICRAGYDAASVALEGLFAPVFDDLQLGFSNDQPATVDGAWSRADGTAYQDGGSAQRTANGTMTWRRQSLITPRRWERP